MSQLIWNFDITTKTDNFVTLQQNQTKIKNIIFSEAVWKGALKLSQKKTVEDMIFPTPWFSFAKIWESRWTDLKNRGAGLANICGGIEPHTCEMLRFLHCNCKPCLKKGICLLVKMEANPNGSDARNSEVVHVPPTCLKGWRLVFASQQSHRKREKTESYPISTGQNHSLPQILHISTKIQCKSYIYISYNVFAYVWLYNLLHDM